ncbi:hypothetical protein [Dokdonella sp.]|uniref:hypothetical protein n=1 Tax=Dokdonella sp. TaxID=2291710 RepID=UPI00352706DD
MSDADHDDMPDSRPEPAPSRRVAFEQLRERTDELELLISGISLLALIALPNWLLDRWVGLALHLDGDRLAVVTMAFPLAIGLSYSLAGAFLLHLAVRAYWVGLIGLKAVFPSGIRWQSLRNIGPITREYYQQRIVDLETSIHAADRAASIIFATISLIALSVLWVGLLLVGVILLGMLAGYLLSVHEGTTDQIVTTLALSLITIPLLIVALDRGSAYLRPPDAMPPTWLRRLLRLLIAVQSALMPQRLVLPVQLSLESNLPRRTFSLAFMVILFSTIAIGLVQPRLAREFAPLGNYEYMSDSNIESGLRSASYESLRTDADRLLFVPMIPSDLVSDSYLRVFLPYVPDRDNHIIRSTCARANTTEDRQRCLSEMWIVRLDDVPVDTSTFVAAERRDLGLRGIQGYVSLNGLKPGAHRLTATRRTNGIAAGDTAEMIHQIPFWFAPPYQLDLPMVPEAPNPAEKNPVSAVSEPPGKRNP